MTSIVLGRRYEILEQIDSGGMADIYKAFCIKTNKIVALKLLKDKFSSNAEYVHRFKREAETVFALDHENIVSVTDIGFDGGAYYLVMEYIEGCTLKALIEKNGRIDESEAVQYSIQLCSALSAAHKKGIIHRDIKPHNILIDNDKKVKLTDFGIAKSISSEEEQENNVVGSVHYISPEQARGERIDTRSDIYSLGIVLYEMLTGVLPHTGGKTVSVALKHINEEITPPADINNDISDALNYIILKATSKNKKDRYQSAAQLKNDLKRAAADPEGTFLNINDTNKKPFIDTTKIKKKNLFWKVGMLVLLAAVITSATVFILTIFNSSDAKAFVVPNLVGSSIEAAEKTLNNISINTLYEPSESADEGTIISQSPEAGSKAVSGAAINLTISSGPDGLVMPDLFGATLEEAEAQIEAMGLIIDEGNITYEYMPDMAPGLVALQSPEAGEALTGTDTLSLIISSDSAENEIIMPKLTDSLLDQAVSLVYETGFKRCFVYEEENDIAEGTVIRQTPEQGVHTSNTDDIFITVSKYKGKNNKYSFSQTISITEKESKVWVVLEELIGDKTVSFIADEKTLNPGQQTLKLDLYSLSGGVKKVVVYVNNIQVNSSEVTFR